MQVALIGLSHHSAPIDVRERFSCPDHALAAAFASLTSCPGVREAVILSTCNRVEVYVAAESEDTQTLFTLVIQHLARFHKLEEAAFAPLLYCKADYEAAAHLLRVAGGLDSLVLGEPQILGQVRHALRAAQEAQAAAKILTKLFETALATGKRIRTETGLGKGGFSIGHAAVDLASHIFDDFAHARVLILGAGKMSEETAQHLVRSGVKFVLVANRTYERAVAIAERLGGKAISWDEALQSGLAQADIVLASTAAPHTVIRRDNLQPIIRQRRGRPLFLIDIAVPRDIDPDVNELDNVFLYNIDDLQNCVLEYTQSRAREADQAQRLVDEEAARFMAWYHTLEAAPIITDLRLHLEQIRQEYLAIFGPRLAHLSERDRSVIEALSRAMMDQVAREPILRLKRAASELNTAPDAGAPVDLLTAARHLFGLDASEEQGSGVRGQGSEKEEGEKGRRGEGETEANQETGNREQGIESSKPNPQSPTPNPHPKVEVPQ